MSRVITYRFGFSGVSTKEFRVELETPALRMVAVDHTESPAWVDLKCEQCPNCPLTEDEHPRCPVALNVAPVLSALNESVSYEDVKTTVITEDREYVKQCPLQTGLSSLIGLMMATSGCPVLDRLRPMAYTHLPFCKGEETTHRAITTYLLSQYIRQRQGHEVDWEFDRLLETYEDVRTVNRAFAGRIRTMCGEDAGVNAVVILDTFASLASFALHQEWWKEFEPLCAPSPDAAARSREPSILGMST